jgi:uncharacterized membrane protein YdjX (TVP38/TMEM64 family)
MDHSRKPAWRRIAALALAIALVGAMAAIWIVGFPEIDEDRIRRMTAEDTVLLLAVMLGVMVLQNVLTVIPLLAILSVNVALFGLAGGLLWSWISSLAGAALAYAIARHWFRELVLRRVTSGFLKKIEESGHVYLFLLRVFPFAPSNLVNFAAGISGMPFRRYLLATAAGNLLFQLAVSLIVEGLLSEDADMVILTIVFAVLLAAVFVRRKIRGKRTDGEPTIRE